MVLGVNETLILRVFYTRSYKKTNKPSTLLIVVAQIKKILLAVPVCKHILLSYNPKGACNAAIIAGKVVAFSAMKCYLL